MQRGRIYMMVSISELYLHVEPKEGTKTKKGNTKNRFEFYEHLR